MQALKHVVARMLGGLMIVLVAMVLLGLFTGLATSFVAVVDPELSEADISRELQRGAATAPALATLAVGELLLAVVATVAAVGWFGARQSGLTMAGTRQAVRATLPMLAVVVGVPLAIVIAQGHSLVNDRLTATAIALVVVVSVAIGLAEEVLFRGVLVSWLGGAAAPWLSVAGSALLFGLPHLGSGSTANAISVTFAVGVPFALVRISGGSVLGLAIPHALIDIFALLQFGGLRPPGQSPVEQTIQVAMSATVGAGYVVWYARNSRRKA